ncbi:MAG: GDSL-type esterase/lipase family protein [Anaerohalosphaeraceae bacterium]|jgi:beta-glucosidase
MGNLSLRYLFLIALSVFIELYGTGCTPPESVCDRVAGMLAASNHVSCHPVAKTDAWWLSRQAHIKKQIGQGNSDLLFIGDSITQGWETVPDIWEASFGQWNPVNAGVNSDQTQHVLWRLENSGLENINPKAAVVMIGTNNSDGRTNPTEIAMGIEAVVCSLHDKLPETKILLLAIFPRGSVEQRIDPDINHNATPNPQWIKDDLANSMVALMDDHKKIYYLNINDVFLEDDGTLTHRTMPDLLHLSPEAYQAWADAIMPTLLEIMNQK